MTNPDPDAKAAASQFGFGTQIRKSPFFDATVRWGAVGFSVYNHMYIPRDFGDPEANFWNLVNAATLSDVGVERQVEISGPDAARFTQMLTPRDLSQCAVGQCKYVLITNAAGGVLNDPVLLRLGENRFWLSLADSDILLWAQGVAINCGMDVEIWEPDVSPLQLQGPQSRKIMQVLFGETILQMRYFRLAEYELEGIPLVVSRTGWSNELGYEIYLRDRARGDELWELIMAAGKPFGLAPGHTSTIRRLEAGMLSYHSDMNINTNPFELGLERLVDLEMEADFIGKAALERIARTGVSRLQVGLEIEGDPLPGPNNEFWPVMRSGERVGLVTSAVYSPRLQSNIALAMMRIEHSAVDTRVEVDMPFESRPAKIVPKPFYDPTKSLSKS